MRRRRAAGLSASWKIAVSVSIINRRLQARSSREAKAAAPKRAVMRCASSNIWPEYGKSCYISYAHRLPRLIINNVHAHVSNKWLARYSSFHNAAASALATSREVVLSFCGKGSHSAAWPAAVIKPVRRKLVNRPARRASARPRRSSSVP